MIPHDRVLELQQQTLSIIAAMGLFAPLNPPPPTVWQGVRRKQGLERYWGLSLYCQQLVIIYANCPPEAEEHTLVHEFAHLYDPNNYNGFSGKKLERAREKFAEAVEEIWKETLAT